MRRGSNRPPGVRVRTPSPSRRRPPIRQKSRGWGIFPAPARAAFRHLPQLAALARFANVAVKATGVPAYATDEYPYRSVHEPLRRVFDAFGPRRFFWGTDITKMPCSWRQCVTLFTEELPWLAGRDLELVMGRAVCGWLGWKR